MMRPAAELGSRLLVVSLVPPNPPFQLTAFGGG